MGDSSAHPAYLPRVTDSLLARKLKAAGAVHIQGPKWCGKTATAQQAAASAIYLQDPDRSADYLQLAFSKPSLLLEGKSPRLIDEWQMAPQLWDAVRYAIDREHGRGRFILTGSSTPRQSEMPSHSGIGRFARITMRTMSLWETRESSGVVSLTELFDGQHDIGALVDFDIERIAFTICRGGWPEAVTEKDEGTALDMAKEYIQLLLDIDIAQIDGVNRNRTWAQAILRSYARNISSQATLATIAQDMQGEPPARNTVSDYVDALNRAFVFEDLPAWNPRLRSKTAVRTSPTRHFCDPSLAAVMLNATPKRLLTDWETFGLLFESLCVHDLRVYVDALGGQVYHYRDKTGLEADAVLVLDDGRWALVEVKLGEQSIDEAADHLKKLAQRINTSHEGEPAFLLVVTGTQVAYRRDDGVLVAPLAALKP
ncbi:ATP-binding protein [Actinotignum timonense]|uniref:ATP-binding protein n=1 Tax=Actinotignum TaxID=1653174 RepID=UPI00254F02BB|nr:DUF4143 domain-containing protein [Actinotignum timonense]MDK6590803.1 DUF4143 domain-containing protein [Actinotignum timonense]MDK6629670.1 DUF4143 domain-containing protein [Actinotignum timonense]MDK6906947.1 DUF4143 domain-containing protein [Actinotignum timonense]MDY5138041.1 DUF4143 domain-containing protein [Actinotignum timonense]